MKAVILHLSDIHIKKEADPILNMDLLIAKTLYEHIDDHSHVVILITGDISYSGTNIQYDLAAKFFRKIESHIKNERNINVDFVMCPGNHDCDFSANPTRDFMLKSMLDEDLEKLDPQLFEACTTHQSEYFLFRDKFEVDCVEKDNLWTTKKIEFGGKSIVFESVNLSWASKLREEQGKLMFPFLSYDKKSNLDADIRISLMHHPLNWLNQSSYRDFRGGLRTFSDFIFTGHEHANNAVNYDDIESGETIIVEGGVLQEETVENSSFGIVSLNLANNANDYYTYQYCTDKNIYASKNKKELLVIKTSCNKGFNFTEPFNTKLGDCGGYFKHSNTSNLKLADIFVYPNLKEETGQNKRKSSISSKVLLSLDKFSKGVVLSGEDNVGSTSLLYALTSEFYSSGLVPVFLKGKEIKKNTGHNLNLQIERALKDQYDGDDVSTMFSQESMCNKILLIDDFDESSIKSESSRNEALLYLMSKFAKVIITVDGMFEVSELTSLDGKSFDDSFDHYKIEQFGYKKRTELITRWYSVGQQDHETEAEMVGKCNLAERLMDDVMDKSLISPNPIFLLTFLQSIDTGESAQLSDSALGHYYKYLLTQSFLDVGVGAESIGQELDYAMHLARFFSEKNTFSITSVEFKEFNRRFSETWQETDFERKEKRLLKAKVLMKVGSDYEFKYNYNYYYLLGMYLSQNILDDDVQKEISHCIEHLYVKKNANTILFLAHHSSSDNILLMMKQSADGLFEDNIAADFNGGCSVVHELIKDAPTLEYNHKSPQQNRGDISDRRDMIERGKAVDDSNEEEQDPSSLDFGTKVTMLFKTIDILSQIIKSNPTKFQRIKKVEILKTIFSAPLRALQDFYNLLESNPTILREVVDYALSHKSNNIPEDERADIARLAVSQIIQGISSSFIIKAAQVINSDVLKPDIPAAINHKPTLALELIDLAISVDNHKPLERRKLDTVYKKCEKNPVAQKVFDSIVMNRLHMYKTSEMDMQWLQGNLNYDLKKQHSISYDAVNRRSRSTKK